ncbi:MAG TPA: serine/threonine-protein kinase [Kofleriaceae bacterium]|nr:serine/threonine-protein kinase [Kofleriaceae bacterium]
MRTASAQPDVGPGRYLCPACEAAFRRQLRFCPADGTRLVELLSDPLIGQTLGDRYRVQSLLGEGGMGRVYHGVDADGSRYAIKVLFGELSADPRHYERFVREAARASVFDHPNLVRVVEFGSTRGRQPFVVMEFVAGRSLSTLLRREAPLHPERVVSLVADLCRALAYIHGRGIVHRDVKAGNVLVSADRRRETARLFDFGVAVELGGGEARLTTKRTAIGTLSYMSPERALCQSFDHRSDLFSLGVLMYQMLAGERPFQGSPIMIALQSMSLSPPRIADRVPGLSVDPHLEAVAQRLMARDPDERFQNADEVLRELVGSREL